jgi:hypothetical protein
MDDKQDKQSIPDIYRSFNSAVLSPCTIKHVTSIGHDSNGSTPKKSAGALCGNSTSPKSTEWAIELGSKTQAHTKIDYDPSGHINPITSSPAVATNPTSTTVTHPHQIQHIPRLDLDKLVISDSHKFAPPLPPRHAPVYTAQLPYNQIPHYFTNVHCPYCAKQLAVRSPNCFWSKCIYCSHYFNVVT